MNINRDTQIKETNHAGPINAIPPVLQLQAAIITLGTFATMLSSATLNAVLPAMASGLKVADTSIQWMATACLTALTAGTPVGAWAVKRSGATQLWLYALTLFGVFSTVCALPPNVEVLLTIGIMQGLVGGLLVPAGQTTLGLVAGHEHLGRTIGTVGVVIAIALLLGTSLGAVLLQVCRRRVLSFINVPLSLYAWPAGWKLLPRLTIKNDKLLSLDWTGLILILCNLPLLMEGIKGVSLNNGENSGNIILPSVGALFIGLFIYRFSHTGSSLLHLSLFKYRSSTLPTLLMAIEGAVDFGGQFLLPSCFHNVCHEALADVDLFLTPQLIGPATGFPVAGYFSGRLSPRMVPIAGGLLSILATQPLAMIDGGSSYFLVGSVLAIRGSGLALATAPAMAVGLAMAGTHHVSDAAPIPSILQRVGAVAGTALVTACYVRLAHTQGSLAAPQHIRWILISGAILFILSALPTVSHQGSSAREGTG